MQGGLILTPPKFTDYSRERVFGSAARGIIEFKEIGRDISGLPVVFQGKENTCVSCAFTFIRQYLDKGKDLSHESLAYFSKTTAKGATVSQVGDAARKIGITSQEVWSKKEQENAGEIEAAAAENKIKNYFTLEDLSATGIFHALKDGLVAVGVKNFRGVGPHFLVAFDVTPDGLALKCANWWKQDVQDIVEIAFEDVVTAVTVEDLPMYSSAEKARIPTSRVLWKKLLFHKFQAFSAAVLTLLGGSAMQFGAGYTPVTDYSSNTSSYISSTAATIPVVSTKDKAGNEISMASLGNTAYFTLEPGTTREELVACTSKSVNNWLNCSRGLPFQGGSLTPSSTLQFAHNAGSRIVMSNSGQFYTEFVSVTGDQTVSGTKSFYTMPQVTSTTAVPTTDNQLANKYYVDNVGAGGFTCSNVSSTLGVKCTGSVPEKVGISLSTTSSGLYFNSGFSSYPLTVQTSSTGGVVVNGSGSVILDTSDAQTWTGAWTLNNQVTVTAGLGALYVPTPTDNANPTPKNYVDQANQMNYATGTAGVAITSGQPLYVSTTGTLFLTDADYTTTTYPFVGIAVSSAAAGSEVQYARPGGVVTNQTGLTQGSEYYLSGTAGAITATPPVNSARVGRALSTTSLVVLQPSFHAVAAGTFSANWTLGSTVTTTVSLAFVPNRIRIQCNNHSMGEWIATSGGSSFQFSLANNAAGAGSNAAACSWTNTFIYSVFVASSTSGFAVGTTANSTGSGGNFTYGYIAEYVSP